MNTRTDFFCEGILVNLHQHGMHAFLWGVGIMLNTNDTSVEKMRYISRCNDVAFNFYILGNLLY